MGWFSSLFSSGGDYSNVGNAILGGIGAALGGKDESPTVNTKESGQETRRLRAFEAGLEDFYKQRDRGEKRDAFKNYTQFGNISQTNPGYRNVHTPNKALPLPPPSGGDKEYDNYVKDLNKTIPGGG